MKTEVFVKLCSDCGYSTKKEASKWCEANPKEDYSEDDFQRVYDSTNSVKIGGHKRGWRNLGNGSRCTINYVIRGLAGSNKRDCY